MIAEVYSDLRAASNGDRRAAAVAASEAPIPVAKTVASSRLSETTGR
jgi:hypothetical protein